jgi:hypothetical protein
MRQKNLAQKMMYREHFFTLCVIGLDFANAVLNFM